jgi:hypothetical protein
MPARRIKDAKVSVGCPPSSSGSGEEWTSFQFRFHDFTNLATTKDHFVASPEFNCNGHQWDLRVYPGGNDQAGEGKVSVFLAHLSKETITASYGIKIVDKFGNTKKANTSVKRVFIANKNWGWDIISRSDILDESQNILEDNGTLTLVVSIAEEPTTAFVPKNLFVNMMQKMFNDQNTADVCFEVGNADEGKRETRKTKTKSSVSFFAHRSIIQKCAPMLAVICESNDCGGVVTASVNDIKPEIFNHLLSYVYGWTIPEVALKAHAKDIIDAADKYSIVNLKLAAEAAYVKSTDISLDNAMDNLLYADSRNCALLKEAVMNFLADNHYAAAAHISFTDFPGHVVKDLLIAVGKSKKKVAGNGTNIDGDELTTLSVSELRRKLHKMGLDLEVDGSREAMIESIKIHS